LFFDNIMENMIIIYDGNCGLCSFLIKLFGNHQNEHTLKLYPYESDAAQNILTKTNIRSQMLDTVICILGDRVSFKSDAVITILKFTNKYAFLLFLLQIIPKRLRDKIYDWVAENRLWIWGRTESCSADLDSK
jgi:predicted DCC family thiol-disulfide oxidoreductase YuxK